MPRETLSRLISGFSRDLHEKVEYGVSASYIVRRQLPVCIEAYKMFKTRHIFTRMQTTPETA